MNCIKCGNIIEIGDKFCCNCGEPVRLCEKCGRQLEEDELICRYCNGSIDENNGCDADNTSSFIGNEADGTADQSADTEVVNKTSSEEAPDKSFVFCGKCGERLPYGSIFCDNCGSRLDDNNAPNPAGNTEPDNGIGPDSDGIAKSARIQSDNTKTNNTVSLAIIILLLVIIVLGGFVIYFLLSHYSGNRYTDTYDVVSQQYASPTRKPSPKPTELPLPVFNKVAASSTRGTDTEGGQYSAEAVLSKDLQTKWVPQKSSDGGINEWIEIYSDSIQYVSSVQILNGYHKDPNVWRNNNRVKKCTITFSNGETRDFVLDDTMDLIDLELGEVIETTSIRLTIRSLYYGTKWNDTAITYIGAY
ncbi:MAG: zinc ribbon domain-containing protein [Candidatus Ornithomonoglobus sp.]